MQKFVEAASVPIVTLYTKDPSNHPFLMKFFESPNDKVLFCLLIPIYVLVDLLTTMFIFSHHQFVELERRKIMSHPVPKNSQNEV